MIAWLKYIGQVLASVGQTLLWALESAINAVIAGVGAAAAAILGLLPSIPDPPSSAGAEWIGWLNWFFPLGPAIAAATGVLALYVAMLVIRIGLRWVKAL